MGGLGLLLALVLLLVLPTLSASAAEGIAVGEQTGAPLFGKGGQATFSVGEGFGAAIPNLHWVEEEPAGVSVLYEAGLLTLTVPAETLAGEYPFYLESDGGISVSEEAVLTVGLAEYEGEKSFAAGTSGQIVSVPKLYKLRLPELPEGVAFTGQIRYEGTAVREYRIEEGFLYFRADPELDSKVTATLALQVDGGRRYEDFDFLINLTVLGRIPVMFTGLSTLSKVYDGTPLDPGSVQIVTRKGNKTDLTMEDINVYWLTEEGDLLSAAPTRAGSYRLMFAVRTDHKEYFGNATFPITISKRSLTLRPQDLEWEKGKDPVLPVAQYVNLMNEDLTSLLRILGPYREFVLLIDGEEKPLSAATEIGEYLLSFREKEALLAALAASELAEKYEFVLEDAVYSVVAHRHVPELRNYLRASCSRPGYSGDAYCTICEELLEVGEEISQNPHRYSSGNCLMCGIKDPNYQPPKEDQYYTFAFVGEDGTVYKQGSALYGTKLEPPQTPVKAGDGAYTYKFSYWSGYTEGMTLAGNVTFVAVFAAYPIELPTYQVGDVDQNGHVNGQDAALLLEYLVGKKTLTPEQERLADVYTEDSVGLVRVNLKDALLLRQFICGMGVSLGGARAAVPAAPALTVSAPAALEADAPDLVVSAPRAWAVVPGKEKRWL